MLIVYYITAREDIDQNVQAFLKSDCLQRHNISIDFLNPFSHTTIILVADDFKKCY